MKKTVVLFLFVLLICGCGAFKQVLTKEGGEYHTAWKAYQDGNYADCVVNLAAALTIDPKYDDAILLMQDAYPKCRETLLKDVKTLEDSSSIDKWDDIFTDYRRLVRANGAASGLLPMINPKTKEMIVLKVENYTNRLEQARTNAAEAHYQEGVDRTAKYPDDKDQLKQAVYQFEKTAEFVKNYRDSTALRDTALKAAKRKIAVLPFKNNTLYNISDILADKCVETLIERNLSRFSQFLSREQLLQMINSNLTFFENSIDEDKTIAGGKSMGLNVIIIGDIKKVNYVPPKKVSSYQDIERIMIVTNTIAGSVSNKNFVREKLRARITYFEKTSSVDLIGSYKVIDVDSGLLKKAEVFNIPVVSKAAWTNYSGDSRAFDVKTFSSTDDMDTDTVEQMLLDAAGKLSEKLTGSMIEYLND
jgi:hypothetical protein